MSARVTWTKGGEARVVSIAADAITLRSSVPWPPGSRVEGVVQTDGKPIVLRMKVHSSKREGDRDFILQGRPIDLARDARERLEGLVGTVGTQT
ncbi:MAG: hypothetical protein WBY94_13880 [Polyangiaceae bacterium]